MNKITVEAPSNIALIKYWGKEKTNPMVPFTSSLSVTLSALKTTTTIQQGPFSFSLNGVAASQEDTRRIQAMLKHFPHDEIQIASHNNFPTAAGLASSASGFAALAVALNAFFHSGFTLQEMAILARLGSGSACRSFTDGFTIWHKEGRIESLANPFHDLHMLVVVLQDTKKSISSREAMKISVATSPYFPLWVEDSKQDLITMRKAIEQKDFIMLGQTMEINSERLYKVMLTSQPVIDYRLPKTHQLLKLIFDLRREGLLGFFTLDAGANVKILVEGKDVPSWKTTLSQYGFTMVIDSPLGGSTHIVNQE